MTLNDVWFLLFILIIAGYLILDGFDMGVGILLLPLAHNDTERRRSPYRVAETVIHPPLGGLRLSSHGR